ncbi:hypothetical protein ACFLSE_09140 [Bacteroidota bacterium]
MKNKRTILILFVCFLTFYSCDKDDIDLSKIDEIVGSYSGDYYYNGGWVLYSPTITKFDSNTLLLDYWPSGPNSIKLKIDGNSVKIENQIFNLERHSLYYGHLYYYDLRLSANGTFENSEIRMSFSEEIKLEGENEFIEKYYGNIILQKTEL